MSFLTPSNLSWALVAVIVLLVYLARLGGRRLDVSAYSLWQRALARRSGWSRVWQWWVSLAVALAFVGLLVLALTRPFFFSAVARARNVVLVIDASASMNATDVEPSRLTHAKGLARQIIDRMEPYEQAAVVAAGVGVSVASGFTREKDRVRAAVDAVPASEGPTRLADAVELARRLVADRQNPQIIVLTDGAFDEAEQLAAAEDLKLVVVAGAAAAADNVGITRLATRSVQLGEVGQREAFIEVANFGPQTVECPLKTRLGDTDESVTTLRIPASGFATHVFPLNPGEAGLVVASLDQADLLPADDRAQMLIPATTIDTVTVVAGADSPVAIALSGLHDAIVQVVDALPDNPAGAGVTVFHGRTPQTLPLGPTLVIEPDASCDLWQLDDASGVARQVEGRVTHVRESPLLAGIDLSRAVMEEKVALQMTGDFEPLVVDESDFPLYLLVRRLQGGGPVLVLTARLAKAKSDLTLRRDFPLLLANAVRWLGGSEHRVVPAMSTADPVRLTPATEARTLVSPDGRRTPLAAEQPLVGPLARGGLWSVTAANSPPTDAAASSAGTDSADPAAAPVPDSLIAVSLLDADESDIRPRVTPTTQLPENLLAGGPGYPLWIWLVVLAVLICLVEWYLYHRRILV